MQHAASAVEGHLYQAHDNHESRPQYRFFSTDAATIPNIKKVEPQHESRKNEVDNGNVLQEDDSTAFLVMKYRAKANESNVMIDGHQIRALKELDRLRSEILASSSYKMNPTSSRDSSIGDGEEVRPASSIFSLDVSSISNFLNAMDPVQTLSGTNKGPKGVYLHGGVGCGKTFCMDLFYEHLPIASKQKVHFHKFMLDVHKQMHEAKMVKGVVGDVLPSVIEGIIENGLVICFDEFQVSL